MKVDEKQVLNRQMDNKRPSGNVELFANELPGTTPEKGPRQNELAVGTRVVPSIS